MPSRLTELLSASAPAGLAVPEVLDRAFSWMEQHGGLTENDRGLYLSPYAGERQLGVVFTDTAELTGWFEPGQPGHDRLLPVAEIDGSGSLAVLWLDDDGAVRVGALGSDGDAYWLADDALELLRLVAVGYLELQDFVLPEPPDTDDDLEAEAVEAHADFRAWVGSELGVEVPAHWQVREPDPFAAWVAATLGR